MKAIRLSRKIHKWFALVLGVQLFLWALSGFYMVAVHIDIIHGDMLIENVQQSVMTPGTVLVPFEQVANAHPDASSITLKTMMSRPVYRIEGAEVRIVDANTGELLSPLNEQLATEVATFHYAGDSGIQGVMLVENDPPTELQGRPLPIWRVDFDDVWNSSFYIEPSSGEFTIRRHTLWRVFDFLWMLHIMDYDEREDINNTVLRVVSVLGTLMGLSGVWLLFYSFNNSRKRVLTQ
ncbi:MAG: PepSY domain-containing protein [Gammaproteobacteria bacterium]|nr:PepSY domain-containing protein [Gammaproteobacteria bacterium]